MTRVVACIPTIGLSPYLRDLCQSLAAEQVETRLYVNSHSVPNSVVEDVAAAGWKHVLYHRPGRTIYQEWNEAAEWACELDAYVLILNDDIAIGPGFPGALGAALDANPDFGLISSDTALPRAETYPGGGVIDVAHHLGNRREFANWAFIARPEAYHMVDEGLKIWYGDDDLIWKVCEAGWRTGLLRGVGVFHDTSTTSRQMPWTVAAAGEDGARWTATGR